MPKFFLWHSIYGVNTRDCTKINIGPARRAQCFSMRARARYIEDLLKAFLFIINFVQVRGKVERCTSFDWL